MIGLVGDTKPPAGSTDTANSEGRADPETVKATWWGVLPISPVETVFALITPQS